MTTPSQEIRMMFGRRWLAPLVLAVALVVAPSPTFATITGRIVENVGVKTAKLGLDDHDDAKKIGGSFKAAKDNSYAGLTVWRYLFGAKMTNGKYAVEMYSKGAARHVFTFIINTTKLATTNGSHVGTTEAALTSRYGTRIKKSVGPVYTDYYMGTRSGRTDFWVLNGKVHHIVISRY
jgi:hypothetical protein